MFVDALRLYDSKYDSKLSQTHDYFSHGPTKDQKIDPSGRFLIKSLFFVFYISSIALGTFCPGS